MSSCSSSRTILKVSDTIIKNTTQSNLLNSTTHSNQNGLVRLANHLANLGYCGKNEADSFVRQGMVLVNNKIVTTNELIKPSITKVSLIPRAINIQKQKITIVLHKPLYYASFKNSTTPSLSSTTSKMIDTYYPLARRLLTAENHKIRRDLSKMDGRKIKGLVPCDNLGTHASGLLIFTQDGRVGNKMACSNKDSTAIIVDKRKKSTILLDGATRDGETSLSNKAGKILSSNEDASGIEDFIRKRAEHKPWEFLWEDGEEERYKFHEKEYYERSNEFNSIIRDANLDEDLVKSKSHVDSNDYLITIKKRSKASKAVLLSQADPYGQKSIVSLLESHLLDNFEGKNDIFVAMKVLPIDFDTQITRSGTTSTLQKNKPFASETTLFSQSSSERISLTLRRGEVSSAKFYTILKKCCTATGVELENFVCTRIGNLELPTLDLAPGNWMVIKNPLETVFKI